MKKIITLSLLFALAILGTVQASIDDPTTESALKYKKLTIIIGRPKFNCEYGFGICKLEYDCGCIAGQGRAANIYPSYTNSKLTIEFSKEEMGPDAAVEFKGALSMPIDENINISPETSISFGATKGLTILAGKYPIKETATSYIIVFNCK